MKRKLEKLIAAGGKLELKVDGPGGASAANNIVAISLTPKAKVALMKLQEINSTPPYDLVKETGSKIGFTADYVVKNA